MTEPGERPPEPEPSPPATDGRHLRAQRSRERILAALEQIVAEGEPVRSPEEIVARAGVSLSTFFRHFGDFAGLARAVRERVEARVRPHLAGGPIEGDLRERVRELVRRLTTGFGILAPFYRFTVRDPSGSAATRDRPPLEVGEATRAQVRSALGAELAGRPDAEVLVCTLLSFEAWDHQRTVRGLPPDAIPPLLERGVLALLAQRQGDGAA